MALVQTKTVNLAAISAGPNPTVATTTAHTFVVGSTVVISNYTGTSGKQASFVVQSVPSATTFTINSATALTYTTSPAQTVTGETGLNATYMALVEQHLNNVAALGFRAIRVHGLDTFNGCNMYSAVTNATTCQLDPCCCQALAWFMDQCKQRNIRVVITVHYNRVLTPTDLLALTNNGANPPPPEIAELMANSNAANSGVAAGGLWPWKCFFPSVVALDAQYESQLFSYISPYDGKPLGQNVALMGLVIENEHLLGKVIPWSFNSTTFPNLQNAFTAQFTSWCQANSVNIAAAGQIQHGQFAASLDVNLASNAIKRLQTLCPGALMVSNTYFGNAAYPALPGCQVGNCVDFHGYSRYAATDTNGFLNGRVGQSPADPRCRYATTAAGNYCAGKSQWNTEVAGVGQYSGGVADPPTELAEDLTAIYTAAINQDLDFIAIYSYASTPLQGEGSPYWKPSVYDQRVNAPFMSSMQWWNTWFANLQSRQGLPTVTVTATGGLYGSATVPAPYGPYTDPALYAVAAGLKVIFTP
jgi:hypothetical protein